MKINANEILLTIKLLIPTIVIAGILIYLVGQPFYVISPSMEPSLLVGDTIFVTKYSYGYSKHSLPIIKNRVFYNKPNRGDVILFRRDNADILMVKRLIGMPGDSIQFIEGDLYINKHKVLKTKITTNESTYCGDEKINTSENFLTFNETLPNGKTYSVSYRKNTNSDIFIVPDKHYFFLGDNRDCSKDSRTYGSFHENNLIGKARGVVYSANPREYDYKYRNLLAVWNWKNIFRLDRFFTKIS